MEENNRAQTAPRLCRKGCGFFGNPNFDGFCSKCHRDMQLTAEKVQSAVRLSSSIDKSYNEDRHNTSQEDDLVAQLEHITSSLTDLTSNISSSENVSDSETCVRVKPFNQLQEGISVIEMKIDSDSTKSSACPTSSSDAAPQKRLRCLSCNKRVGLTGFNCRCGGIFCTIHRYSDSHECPFDYRQLGQSDIRKANPQVICSKINKL